MFGSTNTKLWSGGPQYGYIMAEYPEGSQCQITRELDGTVLKARGSGSNWAFALPEAIGLKIPKEYQEVEYIQSTGNQFINTGILASGNFKILSTIELPQVVSGENPLFSIWISSPDYWNLFIQPNAKRFDLYISGHHYLQELELNQKYFYSLERNGSNWISTLNDNVIQSTIAAGDTNTTPLKFLARGDGVGPSYWKLGPTKVYKNDMLVGDFYPCYRKSDSVAGMYDIITNTFFTNAGTGIFTVGLEVGDIWTAYCTDGENEAEKKVNILYNGDIKSTELYYGVPKEYQEVEYIIFPTGAYIDTLVSANISRSTEIKISEETYVNDKHYIGGNQNDGYGYHFTSYNNQYYCGSGSNEVNGGTWVSGEKVFKYNDAQNNFIPTVNGQNIVNSASEITRDYNIWLGRRGSVSNFSGNMYYCYIRNNANNGLVFEGYPCYRKSDSAVGLWDRVSETLFVNTGTGTLVAGPDMN